jgi:hypothetical protein
MTKTELHKIVKDYGDAVITYRSLNSNKLKYNVCTLDFDCAYIQSKNNKSKETSDTLLMFCWDTDTYRLVRPANITSIIPLDVVLGNNK